MSEVDVQAHNTISTHTVNFLFCLQQFVNEYFVVVVVSIFAHHVEVDILNKVRTKKRVKR